ncbi:hypothetical protein [Devosia sp. RR2S18]|uniref:hypothetical protein n=1 Tax=Devosia rhizosphaerae TaxID=3049774 RepID=UPI0025400C0D|nr:hypothetical protein [Devosia sp. RR2S18]WIJ25856.1 hypothetical protein QOV41_03570 [Devosia sp. RR2S18]
MEETKHLIDARRLYSELMASQSSSDDPRLQRIFETVPREAFLPPNCRARRGTRRIAYCLLCCAVGETDIAVMLAPSEEPLEGKAVRLAAKPTSLHLFDRITGKRHETQVLYSNNARAPALAV